MKCGDRKVSTYCISKGKIESMRSKTRVRNAVNRAVNKAKRHIRNDCRNAERKIKNALCQYEHDADRIVDEVQELCDELEKLNNLKT